MNPPAAKKAAPATASKSDKSDKIYHPDPPKDEKPATPPPSKPSDGGSGGSDWRTMPGEELREEASKISVMKQMINTTDGTAEETDAYVEERPYEDVEEAEPVDYRTFEYEVSDAGNPGVAEDDEAGLDPDDPAGSAPGQDNNAGGGGKSQAVKDYEAEVEKANKKLADDREKEAKAAAA